MVKTKAGNRDIPLLRRNRLSQYIWFNPLMGTLKPQSNGPLYSNTVIGTLAVDGWAVTFGTVRRGLRLECCSPYRQRLINDNQSGVDSKFNCDDIY